MMSENHKLFLAISLEMTLLLLINLTLLTWSITRRSADELEKIKRAETLQITSCKESGGIVRYGDGGVFLRCDFSKNND